jgi:hypothetical protein
VQRRTLLLAAAPTVLPGCAVSEVKTFPTVASAMKAIEGLAGAQLPGLAQHRIAWTLAQMLEHAAQSVEYSLRGFPEMKSGLFRATVGRPPSRCSTPVAR